VANFSITREEAMTKQPAKKDHTTVALHSRGSLFTAPQAPPVANFSITREEAMTKQPAKKDQTTVARLTPFSAKAEGSSSLMQTNLEIIRHIKP